MKTRAVLMRQRALLNSPSHKCSHNRSGERTNDTGDRHDVHGVRDRSLCEAKKHRIHRPMKLAWDPSRNDATLPPGLPSARPVTLLKQSATLAFLKRYPRWSMNESYRRFTESSGSRQMTSMVFK